MQLMSGAVRGKVRIAGGSERFTAKSFESSAGCVFVSLILSRWAAVDRITCGCYIRI